MNLPFRNLKFCSTSVPSDIRIEMVSKLKAMGGEHFSHLMSDVDVLIVGDRNTDKFKYTAKNRADIRLVRPKTIYDLYESWIEGGSVQATLDERLLPVFDGLNICISRIDDSLSKTEVIREIKANGGVVTDSLTINNTCVIATERSGKRYEKAKEWGIPVVHPDWVLDSVKRGATLEFDYYDIDKVSAGEYGVGSCTCWDALRQIAQQRANAKRALQDADIEKTVKVRKRDNNIWNNIMSSVKAPVVENTKESAWEDREADGDDSEGERSSQFKLKSRLKSPESSEPTPGANQLFARCNFVVAGYNDESQIEKLGKVLKSHGGEITTDMDSDLADITHVLIPSACTVEELSPRVRDLAARDDVKVVTEWFIERSLHYSDVIHDKWGMPLAHLNLNLRLKICLSGFSGVELLHLTKLIAALGCEYCETLTSKRDLLVINLSIIGLNAKNSPKLFSYEYPEIISCSDSNKAGLTTTKNKINACKKWNIPIVSAGYLMQASDSGSQPELLDYKWCIFAPSNLAKPKSPLVIARTAKRLSEKRTTERGESLTLPKLPSPLKKKKKNWGRIIGRAQESQIGKDFLDDETLSKSTVDELEGALNGASTQISYNDNDAHKDAAVRRDTRNQIKSLNQDL